MVRLTATQPAQPTVALAPVEATARIALTISHAIGKLEIVAARCGAGGFSVQGFGRPITSTPFNSPDTWIDTSPPSGGCWTKSKFWRPIHRTTRSRGSKAESVNQSLDRTCPRRYRLRVHRARERGDLSENLRAGLRGDRRPSIADVRQRLRCERRGRDRPSCWQVQRHVLRPLLREGSRSDCEEHKDGGHQDLRQRLLGGEEFRRVSQIRAVPGAIGAETIRAAEVLCTISPLSPNSASISGVTAAIQAF